MDAKFCSACGAALTPGDAFCSACGARIAADGAGDPAPVSAGPPQAFQPDPVAPPAAPAPSAEDPGNSTSLDLQPGETELGSWTVNIDRGRLLTGKMRVTSHRVMFRPQVGGVGVLGILQTQQKSYKDANTIVLSKQQIVSVRTEKSFLKKNVHIATAGGATYVFGCSPWNIDEVAQAIQRR